MGDQKRPQLRLNDEEGEMEEETPILAPADLDSPQSPKSMVGGAFFSSAQKAGSDPPRSETDTPASRLINLPFNRWPLPSGGPEAS